MHLGSCSHPPTLLRIVFNNPDPKEERSGWALRASDDEVLALTPLLFHVLIEGFVWSAHDTCRRPYPTIQNPHPLNLNIREPCGADRGVRVRADRDTSLQPRDIPPTHAPEILLPI